MDLAANMVKHGLLATWDSVIASSQESGRGQLGRSWHSPPGNLYVSLGLPLLRDGWQDLLSILVATGVLKILLDMDLPARIKWPNDILVGSKKVGGILIEEKQGVILAGIGINLVSSPPFNTMRDRSPIEAASLADFGVNFTPPGIWIELLGSLKARIEKITSTLGKDEFIDAVVPYLAYLGETVVINSENIRGLKATFLGLDPCGGLIIGEKNSERVVRSGSIIPAS
jgi:BirA family biotin operon repressor/biotin-[acetyl-CoA-carboxylase] ligase